MMRLVGQAPTTSHTEHGDKIIIELNDEMKRSLKPSAYQGKPEKV